MLNTKKAVNLRKQNEWKCFFRGMYKGSNEATALAFNELLAHPRLSLHERRSHWRRH